MLHKLYQKYAQSLAYLFFGVLTTAVNYAVYFSCLHLLDMSGAMSNALSWVGAVVFAFVTNKPFVFGSHDWSARTVLSEMVKFLGCRAISGFLETAVIFLTVDILAWSGNWMKLATGVLVIVINYFGGKLLVFRKK